MSEDWAAVAVEVGEAIKSVSSTGAGYPATIRRQSENGGDPWNPVALPEYTTVRVIEENKRVRAADGSYVEKSRRTLTMAAMPGFAPRKSDRIAPGITAEEAGELSAWITIAEVRLLAPAGVAVLHELDLES